MGGGRQGLCQRRLSRAHLDLGARPAIPPRAHRRAGRPPWIDYNRHLVENLWAHLKEWRAVAMRYEKLACSFLGVLCLAATADWLKR